MKKITKEDSYHIDWLIQHENHGLDTAGLSAVCKILIEKVNQLIDVTNSLEQTEAGRQFLKTSQTNENQKSDEQPCFKHDVKHRCFHCQKLIIFDDHSASWIHKRKWTVDDNGYYCYNNKPDIKYTATPNNGV